MKNVNVNAKQAKTAQHVKLEETLLTWFKEVTAVGVNIDGKVLREKADEFALALHIDEFQVSEYEPRDVFNADEAGLFFNLQPEKSLYFKGKECRGGKKSKERITVLLCCNADGSEKLKLTVVGKFQKPRCFKRKNHLPCVYRANKKAWMTAALFEEFLSLLDRRMAYKNRKILLFLDQCAAHPRQVTLQNVKLFFLPANATTHLQPLDAGIVRNVKHHFKSLLVRRLLAKIDRKDEDDPRISLLDAIHFIAVAWNRVTPTTIANCFGKCGFFGSPEEVPPEPEDPTIEDWEQRNVECTSDDFCTADDNLATCGARTVEDIVEEATCEAADSSDDGDDIDVGDDEGRASAAETLHALDVLRRAVAADEVSDDTCTRFYAFEQSLLGDLAKKKRQKDIRDFFIKK
nr:tigger transposable element-derived protein 6-like [Rhipicephalus microplus]